jgi:hypothetical protein
MWKQQSAELHRWLKTTPPASIGAKLFLQTRYGVRPAVPFVPAHAFGLAVDENNWPPARVEPGAEPTGAGNPNS